MANPVEFCSVVASYACGVSSAHLNYTKHPMIRDVYCFHIYYHVRSILKRLQTPLPHSPGFNTADNPYTESEFLKICEDYRVPNDPMRYRDKKFYWTYQCGVSWPDDYIAPYSMTQWIIEVSDGFTDVGLYKILESVRAYAYLTLSSQTSARSVIVGNTTSALTAQSAFLNNFENIVNHRVDIREDIKHYQDTPSYASSKFDYSVGQNIYMLPSDMNLKIRSGTVGYNNKLPVSDEKFSLGKNENVNLTVPVTKSTQTATNPNDALLPHGSHAPNISHKDQEPKTITHNDETIALVLTLASGFAIWNIFR